MKKFLIIAAAAAVLCACNQKQDTPTPGEDTTPFAGYVNCSFIVSDALFAVCDLTVTYTDASGEHQESMTGTEWTKELLAPLPATLSASVNATLKADADVDSEESVKITRGYTYAAFAVNKDGKQVGAREVKNSTPSVDMKKNQISGWLENRGNPLSTFSVSFDKDGIIAK